MYAFTPSAVLAALVASSMAIPMPDAGAKPFTIQNGNDATNLNKQFSSLTPDSACSAGQNACVDSKFAQCVNGKFVLTPCGSGTICAALPLVNKPGTSVTCTTAADRDARIAATGASGGSVDANGAPSPDPAASPDSTPSPDAPPTSDTSSSPDTTPPSDPPSTPDDPSSLDATSPSDAPSSPNASPSSDVTPPPDPAAVTPPDANGGQVNLLQNGKDAKAANEKFATLTADSPCQEGENACINDQFAQCANGKFVLTPCGSGLVCRALPLLKKQGTSNTCVTAAEADQRIKTAGA